MQSQQREEYYFLKFALLPNQPQISLRSSSCQLNVQLISNEYLNMKPMMRSNYANELFPETKENTTQFYSVILQQGLSQSHLQQILTFKCNSQQPSFETTVTEFQTNIKDLFKTTQKVLNYQKRIIISNDFTHKLQVTVFHTQQPKSLDALQKMAGQGESKITVDSLNKFQNLTTEESFISNAKTNKFKRTSRTNVAKFERKTKRAQTNDLSLLKESRVVQKEVLCQKSARSLRFLVKTSKLIPLQYYNEVYEVDESKTWESIKRKAQDKLYVFTLFVQVMLLLILMSPSSKL